VAARLFISLLCLAVVPAAGAATAPAPAPAPLGAAWANAQIRAVTAAGLMGGGTVAAFHASDTLTAQALENVVFELRERLVAPPSPVPTLPTPPTTTPTQTAPAPTTEATTTAVPAAPKQVADLDRPVTIAQLDSRLVAALGLGKAAAEFAHGAKAAGLAVPSRFGTEVVARLLGLRLDHPAAQDALELLPGDPATRAEAAYSVAQILSLDGGQVEDVQELADGFALPALTDWQRRILTTAVARIGMPYVWGGASDGPQTAFGVSSRGGYDCSGFVWRVYKLAQYPDEGSLASTLQGRTTYQMSGEVPRAKRLALADLEPADVVFFGDKGPRSKPAQVGHMGIYLGDGWFIHSSEYGVALARLDGWYAREFAWARRPLAEAGLAS
jgi:cell wall-associated NlpC family hydrolase